MKTPRILLGATLVLLLSTLGGCKADVDLANIDTSAEANLALALPIGDLSATLGDFIGDGDISEFLHVGEDGLLFIEDTFEMSREFYDIDLTRYVTNAHKKFSVGDTYGGITVPKGTEYKLRFPLSIKLNNINAALADGSYQERIDSIWIRAAQFTSNFGVENFALPYSDIKKLEIVLDKNFSRAQGSTIEVPLSGSNYHTDIPITVDEFTLNLMKEKTKDPSNVNVINEVNFEFVFTIVPSSNMVVNANAAINYDFKINFLQYHAIWGWFRPSNQMRDADTIRIADEWEDWNKIKNLILPFAEPEVHLDVYNSIGMPLVVDGDYLFVEATETNETKFAQFDGNQAWSWPMLNFVHLNEPIDKVVKNTYVFSKDPSKGAIDKLFSIRPDVIGYKYNVYPNNSKAEANGIKHYRLSENTKLDVDAILHIPFTFNEGTSLAYGDTVDSIDIEEYEIDSLLADLELAENIAVKQLKLIMNITNTIPFDIEGEAVLLDENDQPLDFNLTSEGNKIHISGPSKVENGVITEPTTSNLTIEISQEKYDQLLKLKKVIFNAKLGNNTAYVRVLDKSGLKIRLGVGAHVAAGINLEDNNQ